MSDFKFVIFVFFVGFLGFFGFFYSFNNSQEFEIVSDIPSKSGKSVTVTVWDSIGMAMGLVPEVQYAEFLAPARQSRACQISRPSKDAKIIWINTMSSDFVSPVQIENGGHWPLATKLINVSVGRVKEPVFLVLESYTDVVWNLNIPDGVVVEGVVTASLLPSAIANVPEGTEKLVTTFERNENAICPLFRDFPTEDEMISYLGRKPDRILNSESESLFVIQGRDAPPQGISRLDARKIYSPVNMMVGKEPYILLHVEEAEKTGAIVRIGYRDALEILTASNKPANDDLAAEIKDQFLHVSENYRLILSDFDLPDNFLNESPQTFFVPSDVTITGLRIPASTNPRPKMPPALKSAVPAGEIEEETFNDISENQAAMDAFMMQDSDKYFRRIGVHAFAPLDLTKAEIEALIDLDMALVE